MLNDQRRVETITFVFFPSGPWRQCSTSQFRQCSGAPPTGCSQAITSESGPERTSTFSVIGGLTERSMTKAMAGWEKLSGNNGSPSDAEAVPTVVLDLQRDELCLQRPLGGRAVYADVDVCEARKWGSCEFAAASEASWDDIVGTFLCLFHVIVPDENTHRSV